MTTCSKRLSNINILKIENIINSYKVKNVSDTDKITKNVLLEMLELEEKIRFSKPYIDECTNMRNVVNGWLVLSGNIQKKIAHKFGYSGLLHNTIAVNTLRRASLIYPDDPRFKNTSVYVRNNIARDGDFKIGDNFPDLKLSTLTGDPIKIRSLLDNQKYNIIIASSET